MVEVVLGGCHSIGHVALIDDEDAEKVGKYKWCVLLTRGVPSYADGSPGSLHRFVMDAQPGQMIDHKNGNGFDCRKENLRFATRSENCCNALRIGSTGYCGVSYVKSGKKYQARVQKDNRRIYIGVFKTPKEAALAYNRAARAIHGQFVKVNDIPGDDGRAFLPPRLANHFPEVASQLQGV